MKKKYRVPRARTGRLKFGKSGKAFANLTFEVRTKERI